MSWVSPSTVVAGQLLDAAFWNQQIRDNSLALRAGGIQVPFQAAGDLLTASSATDLARFPASTSAVPYFTGGVWTMRNLLDLVYPVASLFYAVVATNPATLLGLGSWQAYGTGLVEIGVNTADPSYATSGLTGGAKTHTLATAEMPAHGSVASGAPHAVTDAGHPHLVGYKLEGSGDEFNTDAIQDYPSTGPRTSQSKTTGITIANAGSGTAHNNMQPYVVFYRWRRIA